MKHKAVPRSPSPPCSAPASSPPHRPMPARTSTPSSRAARWSAASTPALAGFSAADSQGKWSGMDVDYCRALAAAILGDANKVRFSPLTAQQRFTALQSGEIDVLSRNTTWTLTRDASLGMHFVGVTYYDGQGFMVPKSLKVTSAKQLKGATVCVQSGTTTEQNLTDYSRANNLQMKPVVFEKVEAATGAYFAGRCQAYTTDASGLASVRGKEAAKPDDHVILPELISKEPLGPAVRRGDDEFFAIAKWTLNALLEAEEYGITQANVDQMKKDSKNPGVMRLLGSAPRTPARCWAWTRTGPTAPSRPWATTARCSSAMSARRRPSACRAAPTTCGPMAA